MSGPTLISVVERFFLDLMGSVVPGAILIGGVAAVVSPVSLPQPLDLAPPSSSSDWAALIVVSYVLGHVLTSLSRILKWLHASVCSWIRKRLSLLSAFIPRSVRSDSDLNESILRRRDFLQFVETAGGHFPWLRIATAAELHAARNLAISLVPGQEQRIYRFKFLSLLNFGVATAITLVALVWACEGVAPGIMQVELWPLTAWAALLLVLLLALLERGFYFNSIAMAVPFSMATAALVMGAIPESSNDVDPKAATTGLRIYLAGGFASGWQERVAKVWRGRIVDPRRHRLENENEYAFWDLEAIRASDWVLAYLEAANPGGYALALEVGFAKALGKRVLLVDEKSAADGNLRRHLGMLRASADVSFPSLAEALEFLNTVDFEDVED